MRKFTALLIFLAVIPGLPQRATARQYSTQQSAPILVVEGLVEHRLELSAADLAAMPRAGGELTDHDGTKKHYEGVSLTEILQRAGVQLGDKLRGRALTTGFVVEAADGYRVAFTLGELEASMGNRTVIVADRLDGKPLAGNEGPLRLIVPGEKHPARSARMVKRIVVVRIGA